LASGVAALASGVAALVSGVEALASGVAALASGVAALAAGAPAPRSRLHAGHVVVVSAAESGIRLPQCGQRMPFPRKSMLRQW
jgi:X-X-X-Leu-X-X-Gly heptad repeat protein